MQQADHHLPNTKVNLIGQKIIIQNPDNRAAKTKKRPEAKGPRLSEFTLSIQHA